MKPQETAYPYVTSIVVLSSITAHAVEGLRDIMIYDRAAIMSGELWRLITGHVMHFSWRHISWNCVVLLLTGITIEYRRYPGYSALCLLSALTISLSLLLFRKTLTLYCGLSGVVTALVVYLCLNEIQEDQQNSILWIGALIFVLGKITLEFVRREPLFVSLNQESGIVVPEAHLSGFLTGAWYWLRLRWLSCFLSGTEASQVHQHQTR